MRRRTLREAREKAKLTQKQLSLASGVNHSVISRLEAGLSTNPTFDTVMKLATVLSVDPRILRFGQRKSTAAVTA